MSMNLKKDIIEAARYAYAYGSSIDIYLNNESVDRLFRLRAKTGKPADEIIEDALRLYERTKDLRELLEKI